MNAETGPGRKRLRLKHIGSIADKEIKRPYLVKGFFGPNELVAVYGEPGSAKSFLTIHFGYLLSAERQIFGRRVRGGPVLYIALEGEAGMERRIAAALQRWGAGQGLFFFATDQLDLYAGVGHAEAVIEAATEAFEHVRDQVNTPVQLIIIDVLARAMGAGSENDPADMGRMIEALDIIRALTGATVLVVHHAGKDKSRGMRGHSSLLGACDTVIEVEKSEAGGHSFRIAKQKDGVSGETFTFDLDVIELGRDEDGDPITSCVVREGEAVSKTASAVTLTAGERGWLKHLNALFAEPNLAQQLVPASGLTQQFCLTREQVREGLKRKGRFTCNPDGNLTGADREKLRAALNRLQDKGKIGMTDKHVWLIAERQ